MADSHAGYLKAMGIVQWRLRSAPPDAATAAAEEPGASTGVENTAGDQTIPANWETLRRTVASCTRCELHRTRTQTVFGVGNLEAEWMFVGEAPGGEEDRKGEPFVGRAGKLLDAMLASVGKAREDVFIANVLKCRPPKNRDPHGEEVRQCEAYLVRQIELVQPRLLIALGRFAAQSLLKSTRPIGKLRGEVYEYAESRIPLVVTYHPAYLLRNPLDKRKAWEDLCLIKRLGESG